MTTGMLKRSVLCACLIAVFIISGLIGNVFLPGMGKAHAHDVSLTIPNGLSLGYSYSFEHEDAADYKGYAQMTVTNTGAESWGDFHFQIYSQYPKTQWSNPANVYFITSGVYATTYKKGSTVITLDSYNLTSGSGSTGAILDLYFDSKPLLAGETATFTVYTDNTTDKSYFGIMVEPSPVSTVPVPAAAWLFGSGLIGLLGFKRKLRK